MDPHSSGRTARSLETLHAMCYFVPEVEEEPRDDVMRREPSRTLSLGVDPRGSDRLQRLWLGP